MPLSPGTTLGPYQVTAKIGEGGMGEVYQARDTTLDRDVALKVLPEAFTSDPDRLARFEREAKVLASLNHPNIGSIYGLEEAEGVKALVLELIEGPTLADRIKQGPIPIDEALPIAKQIAEALEAAHEQGVIHRDLKPANVKVKADGTVKVLDFGLAKAFQPDAGDPNLSASPTISLTAAATQMGMVIGTAAYMAPEQAKGNVVDKRADVWAFGCVLYEMLTARRVFDARDVSEVLASVLLKDPDFAGLPTNVPPGVRSLLTRCLVKEPKDRLRDIGEARFTLRSQNAEAMSSLIAPAVAASVPDHTSRRLIPQCACNRGRGRRCLLEPEHTRHWHGQSFWHSAPILRGARQWSGHLVRALAGRRKVRVCSKSRSERPALFPSAASVRQCGHRRDRRGACTILLSGWSVGRVCGRRGAQEDFSGGRTPVDVVPASW